MRYLTPGVYFESADSITGSLTAIRTDIAAFIGIAQRGPVNEPVMVGSWRQFQTQFGDYSANAYLAYCVKAFFENGGRRCAIVRVATENARASAAQWNDANGIPVLQFTAGSPGVWGDGILVRLARSRSHSTQLDLDQVQPAERSASIVQSAVGFVRNTQVRLVQDGASELRVVQAVSPIDRRLRWDKPLPAAWDVGRQIELETITYTVTVVEGGNIRALYYNLSLIKDNERFIEETVADIWLRVTVSDADRMPDLSLSPMALAGGVDGLSNLTLRDYTGDLGANERHGIRALELVKDVSLVAVPDAMIRLEPPRQYAPPPPAPEPDPCLPGAISAEPVAVTARPGAKERPPEFNDSEIYQIQQALVLHCEMMGDRVAVLDPPPGSDLQRVLEWRSYFDSSYAGFYYPWLLVREPRPGGGDIVRAIPPSGHVAGVIARTDLSTGVHQPPANAVLQWAQGLTEPVPTEYQALLNPLHVNCLRSFNGRGLRVYGARTLSSDPSLRFLNVRRVLMMLRKVFLLSLQWAVFEPHDFYLRERVRLSINSFLLALRQAGALTGATPEESFFVKCDGENNPPQVVDAGQFVVDVGVAIVRPAEFVVFRIGRTRDELEITEVAG